MILESVGIEQKSLNQFLGHFCFTLILTITNFAYEIIYFNIWR